MNWQLLISQIAVLALGMNPKTAPLVPHVIEGIKIAESMKGKTGPQKLEIAVEIIKEGLKATNAIKPGKINIAVSDEVIASATSAVVDSVNVFKKAGLIVNPSAPAAA